MSQEKEVEVKVVLEQFLKSADEANLESLSASMHKNYRNVQYGFFGDPGVFIIDKEKYISLIEDSTFGGTPREVEIISLDIFDHMAMAKVRLESSQLIFHSSISMVFDDDRWQVIENFPHVVVKNQ